jgi:hypothetical protein
MKITTKITGTTTGTVVKPKIKIFLFERIDSKNAHLFVKQTNDFDVHSQKLVKFTCRTELGSGHIPELSRERISHAR